MFYVGHLLACYSSVHRSDGVLVEWSVDRQQQVFKVVIC
jgi:hypothetical protein